MGFDSGLLRQVMSKYISRLATLLVLTSSVDLAYGATRFAQSCSYSDVSTALVDSAAGDELVIPAGECDWKGSSLVVTKPVTIKGSGREHTVLIRSERTSEPLIFVGCSVDNTSASISGIKFQGLFDPKTGFAGDRGVALAHGCQDFKVFDNEFTGFANAGLDVSDHNNRNPFQRGVIFNNRFIENFRVGLGYGISVTAGGRNELNIAFGSQNFVFIEDNYFSKNRHAVTSNLDATYVLRHNLIEDNYPNFAVIDTHGKTFSDDRGGTKMIEVYSNTIRQNDQISYIHTTSGTSNNNPAFAGIGLRGGAALIYDNTVTAYRFPLVFLIESATACADLTSPLPDKQPAGVYVWSNEFVDHRGGIVNDISLGGDQRCEHLFSLDGDYFLRPKTGYLPFTYPHPLRGQSESGLDILEFLPAILSGAKQR